MQGFRNGSEHLLAELRLLDLRLHRQVLRLRAAQKLNEDPFRGLYISDAEIDELLKQSSPSVAVNGTPEQNLSLEAWGAQIELLRSEIDITVETGKRAGTSYPLAELALRFQLSLFETEIVVIAAAPELATRYQTLFGYVQNDAAKRHATFDLCLSLLCRSQKERWARYPVFRSDATLFSQRILSWIGQAQDQDTPRLGRQMQADERMVAFLLENREIDQHLRSSTTFEPTPGSFDDLLLPQDLRTELGNVAERTRNGSPLLVFVGPHGAGKRTLAEAVCCYQGLPMLAAEIGAAVQPDPPFEHWIASLVRECRLQGAGLFLDRFERVLRDDQASGQFFAILSRRLDRIPFPVFFASAVPWRPPGELWPGQFRFVFEIPLPRCDHRAALWHRFSETSGMANTEPDVNVLADKFGFRPGQIQGAVRDARCLAWKRHGATVTPSLEELHQAALLQSNHKLERLASKIEGRYGWDEIVLPTRQMQQLREVYLSVKHRTRVYGDWGFDGKLFSSKGLNILFCGPSGTGKTMASSVLAHELRLDLYKIDLSQVVSKYIGETEKNLDRIFTEARSSHAILFFDEADALFGKRSEVKDAHDRYANIEVAYLLQKMEDYDGICILATNLKNNLDDAFARRMHHTIDFPMPEVSHRRRIWRGVFPASAPLAPDIDWEFLARQFELPGGNIRNIALTAAFLAAEAGQPISMAHLMMGAARELQKLGRLPSQAAFRHYYELIRVAGNGE